MKKNYQSKRPWHTIKCNNLCIVEIPEWEKGKGTERIIEEVTAEIYQSLFKLIYMFMKLNEF